jgi:hypothetical protein
VSTHFATVVDKILEGRVVPFLGAGVNLCDRPKPKQLQPEDGTPRSESECRAALSRDSEDLGDLPEGSGTTELAEASPEEGSESAGKLVKEFRWTADQSKYLPSGSELAEFLAKEFRYPAVKPALDLARVSQFGGLDRGPGDLNDALHAVFARDYPPTSVHQALTSLPMPAPKAKRPFDRYPLIATTNYDDLMERAFPASRELDLVFYDPWHEPRRRFWHKRPGRESVVIEAPNGYDYPFCESRPAILKLHGTVEHARRDHEGFVITEDHYIEYLAEEALEKLLPSTLLDKLRNDHLLFLGYSLKDWNFRVSLRRLKGKTRMLRNSWGIILKPDETDEKFWAANSVEIKKLALDDYMRVLLTELWKRQPSGFNR